MAEIDRRHTLAAAGMLLVAPWLALAQTKPAGKVPRVGFILITPLPAEFMGPDPVNPAVRGFVHGLRDLGYVNGKTVILDIRSLENKWDRLEGIVADLVRIETDVIALSSSFLLTRVAKLVPGIPIVLNGSVNLIGTDLIKSYARPGGNVTGITMDAGPDIEAKRLSLLIEMLPGARRVAYIGPSEVWESVNGEEFRSAARALKVAVFNVGATMSEFSMAFERIRKEKPDAVFVANVSTNYGFRDQIGELVRTSRVPSTCAWTELADAGCMMSFGVDVPYAFRRLAGYVDKILKGAKPADLPIEQPTKFELVINLKTARALGIKIPPSVLLRADRVIE